VFGISHTKILEILLAPRFGARSTTSMENAFCGNNHPNTRSPKRKKEVTILQGKRKGDKVASI